MYKFSKSIDARFPRILVLSMLSSCMYHRALATACILTASDRGKEASRARMLF